MVEGEKEMIWSEAIKKHYAQDELEADTYAKMTYGINIYVDDWKQVGESLFYQYLHAYMLGQCDKDKFISFMTGEGISPLDMGDIIEWSDSHNWNEEWDQYAHLALSA